MDANLIQNQLSVIKKKASSATSLQKVANDNNDLIEVGFEVSVFRRGELLENTGEEKEAILLALREDLKMSKPMVQSMVRIMIEKKWTQERFAKAYEHVLINCSFYPPKVSEFMSYDKKVRFNTYYEIADRTSEYVAVYYKGIGSPLYITKQQQEEFQWELWGEKYRVKQKEFTYEELEEIAKKQDEYIRGINGTNKK